MNRLTMILALGLGLVGVGAAQAAETAPATAPAAAPTPAATRPKQVFAHYMGCWPAGTGALLWQRQNEYQNLRHDGKRADAKGKENAYFFGGHVRNFDLVPPDRRLTAEESADMEIRRAMRIGIDGFAIDAWAGDKDARRSIDALFKVAEEKDYPFQITVCIDSTCGGDIVETTKELLAKHGNSPKLARRDGKPLIFGYMSCWESMKHLGDGGPSGDAARLTREGWEAMGKAFETAQAKVGQPIFYHYCLSAFFHGVDGARVAAAKATLVDAAGVLAKHVPAIGGFSWLGKDQAEIGKAVLAAGAEWSPRSM